MSKLTELAADPEFQAGLDDAIRRERGVNLARIGYEAYGDAASWQNYEGKPMPQWDELPIHIREKWGAAARAIALAILPR